jgi:DNA-binding NarL/FixJ family response regulator
MDGVEAIRAIRQIDPNANIIVLTTFDNDEDIYRALRNGAKAYLLKDISREELIENITAVHHGVTRIPQHVAQKLAAHVGSSEFDGSRNASASSVGCRKKQQRNCLCTQSDRGYD